MHCHFKSELLHVGSSPYLLVPWVPSLHSKKRSSNLLYIKKKLKKISSVSLISTKVVIIDIDTLLKCQYIMKYTDAVTITNKILNLDHVNVL